MEDLGQRFPYRVVRTLGEGAHGVVLLVEHKRLGKPFVLKLIQQRFSANREVVARFTAEAQRVARLDHDAFAPIVDLGETEDGRTYFVMEYVAGTTVQQAIRERGPYALGDALALASQLLEGLAVAHDAKIIHRDIKPANLFVTTRGRLKILDFGISKSMVDGGSAAETGHGIAIGTPKYMSPEQATGKAVSFATDIYAVGLVLFEMLAGVAAFDGSDTRSILYAQIYNEAPSLEARAGRAFPPSLEALVAQALRKEPSARFQTAVAMLQALRAAALEAGATSLAPPSHPSTPPTSGSTQPLDANAMNIGSASTMPAAIVREGEGRVPTEVLTASGETGGGTARTARELVVERARATPAPAYRPVRIAAFVVGALALVVGSTLGVAFLARAPGPAASGSATPRPSASALPEPTNMSLTSVAHPLSSAPPPTLPIASAPTPSVAAVKPSAAKPKGSHYQAAIDALNGGDLELADSEAHMAVAQGGGVPAQLLLGRVLEARGKKAAAKVVYRQILDKDPGNAAAAAGYLRCGG